MGQPCEWGGGGEGFDEVHQASSPPLVEFSNWSHDDFVHVFDNFAWKLAAVMQVSEEKLFLVRVLGSMQDRIVGTAWIRVRHYWQDDKWIVIGKGPSISNVNPHFIRRIMISELLAQQRNTSAQDARRSAHQKSHNGPTKVVNRNLLSSTLDQNQTGALRGLWKISRTGERSSPGTEACTGIEIRSRGH
uniref:Uncharacterized protein n=1 Tax=Kalanchoe fedtschenkoi TaxID=63787 RepID=A0A7N0RFI0_KALFE